MVAQKNNVKRTTSKPHKNTHPRTVFAGIAGLGLLCCAIYLANFKIYGLVAPFSGISSIQFHVIISSFLSVLYLGGVFLIFKMSPGSKTPWRLTTIIIFLGIIFRLCLVFSDPTVLSKDMYRYVWDGRVQQAGINPYRFPPDADELKMLRDDRIFPNINRKSYPTIYPAGAQLYFKGAYILAGGSVIGHKGVMVFFDIMTLLVLAALLRTYGLNPARIIVYAWNPLVIFEISYSGHLEGLMVFLMTSALYLYSRHKKTVGIVLLALSAATKIYPALLFAAFLNRSVQGVKRILIFAATIVLIYLPFLNLGGKISGFLPIYLNNPYESFNLGLKHVLTYLIPSLDYSLLSQLFIIILVISGIVIILIDKKETDALRYAYILAGLLLILMPASLHPWYVILIIPFLAFYPHPAWLIFTCTVTLSYLKYASPQAIMPTWVLLVEYLPLFTLLAAGIIIKMYTHRKRATTIWNREINPTEVKK